MKRWHLFAFGLGIYLLALVVTAPATWADAMLQNVSGGRLQLADARGSLWSGSAQLLIRDAAGRIGVATPLAWRLRPATLLRARLAYAVDLGAPSRSFPVTLSWSRIELAHVDIVLPAVTLGYVAPKLASLELSGEVHLQIQDLVIGRHSLRGDATLQWLHAGSALSPVSPLGNYQLRLVGAGDGGRVTLTTLKGPLQLRGQGSWAEGGAPAFAVNATVPAEYRQRLEPFLRLIAVKQVDGSFAMQLQ
ncbi:MAG: type II secretion system protein N [Rhodanobacter sp.]|nr:MAG: type II secretion system protein N [Rhodanobacter sp.]TAL99374.1 MAG: type II secretion system protein N [Rhodanobacter sp.]TAM40535.1 MAG: type II secretion system protein N [Rhodanobacter sp.]TAN28610.1 MAG: type II secretion system protein N [Rhodanobacter sp.]